KRMLIDPLAIHYSGKTTSINVSAEQTEVINGLRDALLSVGWTLTDQLYAKVSIHYPFGIPITDGITVTPKKQLHCADKPGAFITVNGWPIKFYDPYKEDDVTTPDELCLLVPAGTSVLSSYHNLVAKISLVSFFVEDGPMLLTGVGPEVVMNLVSGFPGPGVDVLHRWNNQTFDPGAGLEVWSKGGGWQMQSSPPSSIYTVTATARNFEPNSILPRLIFDFNLNGRHFEYSLLDDYQGATGFLGALGTGNVAGYTIIANPHGFAIITRSRDIGRKANGDLGRPISLFAMAPFIPTSADVPPSETFSNPYAVFVVGPSGIGGDVAWDGTYGIPAMALAGGSFTPSSVYQPYARLLTYRNPGVPLYTPAGAPIIIGPYVMFGSEGVDGKPAFVVGKLWDCALVSDVVNGTAMIDGKHFTALGGPEGSSSRTPCTLMMEVGEPMSPGVANPDTPTPPPIVTPPPPDP